MEIKYFSNPDGKLQSHSNNKPNSIRMVKEEDKKIKKRNKNIN